MQAQQSQQQQQQAQQLLAEQEQVRSSLGLFPRAHARADASLLCGDSRLRVEASFGRPAVVWLAGHGRG